MLFAAISWPERALTSVGVKCLSRLDPRHAASHANGPLDNLPVFPAGLMEKRPGLLRMVWAPAGGRLCRPEVGVGSGAPAPSVLRTFASGESLLPVGSLRQLKPTRRSASDPPRGPAGRAERGVDEVIQPYPTRKHPVCSLSCEGNARSGQVPFLLPSRKEGNGLQTSAEFIRKERPGTRRLTHRRQLLGHGLAAGRLP